ncbi:MAG TPA: hypothetical protein VE575_16140 [Acidimicrobiales bacterium]|nr:hypothetical protein [Acidimicrobiales bacterium]
MRAVWDFLVALKGTVTVAWHRADPRMAAVAVLLVGAAGLGGYWLVSGMSDDGAGDLGAPPPAEAPATAPGTSGNRSPVPPGSAGPDVTDPDESVAAGAASVTPRAGRTVDGSSGSGVGTSDVGASAPGTVPDGPATRVATPSGTASADAQGWSSTTTIDPSPSTPSTPYPATTSPGTEATTTTTSSVSETPPTTDAPEDSSDPGLVGGLVGGVLDLLGLGG